MSNYVDSQWRGYKRMRSENYLGMPMGDSGYWVQYQYDRYGIRYNSIKEAMEAYFVDKSKYDHTSNDVIFGSYIKPATIKPRRKNYGQDKYSRRRYYNR